MKTAAISSACVGVCGIVLLTTLLATGLISEVTFAGLVVPLALVCVVLLCLPRLRELDMKNLKMTLAELQQVKAEIEEVKAEVVEMYGGIERIQKAPLVLDDAKMRELGLKPDTLPMISAVMRYTAGCMKRERERLARIFISPKPSDSVAEALVDGSMDDKVFKWNGPETPLDAPPKSLDDREREKEEAKSNQLMERD